MADREKIMKYVHKMQEEATRRNTLLKLIDHRLCQMSNSQLADVLKLINIYYKASNGD